MIWDEKEDGYRLSTGKVLYPNLGILGIAPKDPEAYSYESFPIYGGYDQQEGNISAYTVEERREIADFVIALWEDWAKPVVEGEPNV